MTLFVVIGFDRPDAGDLRAATRDTHLAYLETQGERLKLAGPYLDEQGVPVGSLVIVEAADRAAAETFQRNDPYAKAGLFTATELRPWRLSINGLESNG